MKAKKFRGSLIFCAVALSFNFTCSSQNQQQRMVQEGSKEPVLKLFLCGDVMTGRGIDQVLPQSVDPILYETYVKDAGEYVKLAERENGDIETPVSYEYIWGDAMEAWQENAPDLKLINLETSVTTHDEPWPGKGIHYRMHPGNVEVFTVAGIDHVSLANNHTLDWGRPGLTETMESLEAAKIAFSGVGEDEKSAAAPSILNTANGRVLIFSYGAQSSGIPVMWEAEPGLSGVNLLPDLSEKTIRTIKSRVKTIKENGDIAIFSVHWGGNWGYDISERQREFAHRLIDEAGVDLVYGHSSHHPMGMEVYKDKLIIYGAGDFINDYEGIRGKEQYRGELTLMYFPEIDQSTGNLKSLKMVPMEVRKLSLNYANEEDAEWLQQRLNRESETLGAGVRLEGDNSLWLEW